MTKDITNQQLLGALTRQLGIITDNMVVRKDVEEIVEDKLQKAVRRLEHKLDDHQKANTYHSLETRAEVGRINKKLGQMSEGLASATRTT